jgi:YtkA-like
VRSLWLLALGLAAFGGREGNFTIRFEPKAVLQTDAQIPFEISVLNDLKQPLHEAKVTMQIETKDHHHVMTYKAPEVTAGLYLAKPIFPEAGEWSISVEVHRSDQVSTRTLEYTVPK